MVSDPLFLAPPLIQAGCIMQAVPLGFLPDPGNFEDWMEAFAKACPRKKRKGDRRKAGAKLGWLKDRSIFSLARPME